jgi:hypothetical protein
MGIKLQGIVSDIPAGRLKETITPATPASIDIPDFMQRRSMELSREYRERQARLYQKANLTRRQKLWNKFLSIFFE